jgi:hypothetical protein
VLVSARKFRELKVSGAGGEEKEIPDLTQVDALPRVAQAPECLTAEAKLSVDRLTP